MKKIKIKRYLLMSLVVISVFSILSGCTGFEFIFSDGDKLVSEMTKNELLWSVLFMSLLGSIIGS